MTERGLPLLGSMVPRHGNATPRRTTRLDVGRVLGGLRRGCVSGGAHRLWSKFLSLLVVLGLLLVPTGAPESQTRLSEVLCPRVLGSRCASPLASSRVPTTL
jgi:hypothetical protein